MKCSKIHIIRMPEGEEEQGIVNLFEKLCLKNLLEKIPNLMREKVTQIQETQRIPIKRIPKRPTARNIIIKMANSKKRKNLKGSKGETVSNIQGSPDKVSSWLLNGNAPSQKKLPRNIPTNENQRPATKATLPLSLIHI